MQSAYRRFLRQKRKPDLSAPNLKRHHLQMLKFGSYGVAVRQL